MTRVATWMMVLGACAPAAAPTRPLDAADYEGRPLVNPRLDDGRIVYRAFGDHHPECFAFVAEDSPDTETVACPDGALHRLERCPAGRLHRGSDGCVCAPIEGEPTRVTCPEE
jgi:hypothetical protein